MSEQEEMRSHITQEPRLLQTKRCDVGGSMEKFADKLIKFLISMVDFV